MALIYKVGQGWAPFPGCMKKKVGVEEPDLFISTGGTGYK